MADAQAGDGGTGGERPLRFALLGTGFWARFQLAAWSELPGARCVALYNRTRAKADSLAAQFGIPTVYDDVHALLDSERLDFVDIVTDVETHPVFVAMAAARGLPVICQKPMAPSLAQAEAMVVTCDAAGVPLAIHENWRWQTPIRQVKAVLERGEIGPVFRARVRMVSGFPVFANQPFLRDLPQFVLTDMGSHLFDVARFLFGEASSIYCQTCTVHTDIAGEDVATAMLAMGGATVLCEMGYAENFYEHDTFPETTLLIEGARGSIELALHHWVRVTTADGTHAKRYPPPRYPWADPAYDVVHSSIVGCHADILRALRTGTHAETSGADNLKTVRLVFAAYQSAASGRAIALGT